MRSPPPCLRQTDQEIVQLLRGLDGQYVPSGPAGAPHAVAQVLPTGRNFYSVDIRAIPEKLPGMSVVSFYCTD